MIAAHNVYTKSNYDRLRINKALGMFLRLITTRTTTRRTFVAIIGTKIRLKVLRSSATFIHPNRGEKRNTGSGY